MHRGYIKLWRRIKESAFYRNSYCFHLATHLLMSANHIDKKTIFNGQEVIIGRGSLITGLHKLSELTGISLRSLRTSLKNLENIGFLTSRTTNKFRIITICKYEEYQSDEEADRQAHRQSNDNQTTIKRQHLKNEKNEKNENKSVGHFVPPTPDDVRTYCRERKNTVDPERFVDFYAAKGWMVGKNKMKDWRAAVRTWERSETGQLEPTIQRGLLD